MAKCQQCKTARATHMIDCKSVCEACYQIIAATPEGQAELASRQKKTAKRDAITAAEAARKAALSEEERKAEDDLATTQIKRQNARIGTAKADSSMWTHPSED